MNGHAGQAKTPGLKLQPDSVKFILGPWADPDWGSLTTGCSLGQAVAVVALAWDTVAAAWAPSGSRLVAVESGQAHGPSSCLLCQ